MLSESKNLREANVIHSALEQYYLALSGKTDIIKAGKIVAQAPHIIVSVLVVEFCKNVKDADVVGIFKIAFKENWEKEYSKFIMEQACE